MIWTDRRYSLPMLMFWRKGRLSFKGLMAYAYIFFFFSDCLTELFNFERPAIGPIIMTKSILIYVKELFSLLEPDETISDLEVLKERRDRIHWLRLHYTQIKSWCVTERLISAYRWNILTPPWNNESSQSVGRHAVVGQ